MQERLDFHSASPGGFKAMPGLQQHAGDCGLEQSLMELVKMRASQTNGCAYGLDMHGKDARKHFSEKELVDLAMCIIAINGCNRLAIPFRSPVGDHQPAGKKEST
ncbi:MAG: carboxymuconolactone decarboxylase family protein [Ottowia sp.]|nr:carboxymuconolactone decarboxylase family protein [Ottowia sp.]